MIADDASRFQSEARAIAAINHPHICQIYDVGPDYLVLEYLQGEPISGPVTRDEAVRLASQIADALHAAHERGILHRDLKPANVMVVRQGGSPHAKLLDFGIAQLTSPDPGATRTVGGEVMGTPAYMSPEQAAAKPLDARSDVFSFGAVLYELLAGTRAFTGDSTAQILSAVLRDDPSPLEAPPALQQVVSRCLAKDPDRRFQTMADVRHALHHLTVGTADATASIAVLPFANLSADRENEYFGDGLAEEIIEAMGESPEPLWGRVVYHLLTSDLNAAADWYGRMIEHRDPFALVYARASGVEPLRGHPRWPELAARMKLPAMAT